MLQKYKPKTIKTKIANINSFYKKFEILRPELDLNLLDELVTYDDLLSIKDKTDCRPLQH